MLTKAEVLDLYAAHAMQGLLAASATGNSVSARLNKASPAESQVVLAEEAYRYAEALYAEREKRRSGP